MQLTARPARAATGGAGARSSRPGRWRSSGRSRRCPSGSSAVSAAPISVPSSIVPVVSTVTWTRTGTSRPGGGHRPLGADDRGLGLQQVLRGLDEHRVDAAVEQPGDLRRRRRRAASANGDVAQRRQLGARARPSPSTQRGRSGVDQPSATSRAMPGAGLGQLRGCARGCRTRPGWPGSRRTCWSRRSRPRPSKYASCTDRDDVRPGHVEDLVAALVALRSRPGSGRAPGASCPSPRRRRRRARTSARRSPLGPAARPPRGLGHDVDEGTWATT